jgi:ribosomal protein L17
MRDEVIAAANLIANTVIATTSEDGKHSKMMIAAHITAQKKERACQFFDQEVESIYANNERDNHKKRYELAYTNLMCNYFENQFLYSILAKLKTQEARQMLKELTNKGYFEDLNTRERQLTDIRNRNIGTHEYANFEYYKLNFNTDEITEFLLPIKRRKIGF